MRHADAWKTEEDSTKRTIRLSNLIELFKICELLKGVVIEQLQLPHITDENYDIFKDEAPPEGSIESFKYQMVMKNTNSYNGSNPPSV